MNTPYKEVDDIRHIESIGVLVAKAADCKQASDALHFSQAACNIANAMVTLKHIEKVDKELK